MDPLIVPLTWNQDEDKSLLDEVLATASLFVFLGNGPYISPRLERSWKMTGNWAGRKQI